MIHTISANARQILMPQAFFLTASGMVCVLRALRRAAKSVSCRKQKEPSLTDVGLTNYTLGNDTGAVLIYNMLGLKGISSLCSFLRQINFVGQPETSYWEECQGSKTARHATPKTSHKQS